MRKLLLFLVFVILTVTMNSQSLFKPIRSDYFVNKSFSKYTFTLKDTVSEKAGEWFWRLNTGIMGVSYELKKGSKPVPFSFIGFGIGYYYYKNVNGSPFNVWGVNALILADTNHNGIGAGVYGSYNTNQIGLLNLGFHYDASLNSFFIDTGLTFKF